MNAIESLFRARESRRSGRPRKFERERVDLSASLRGRGHVDAVNIADLAPGGMVCHNAPYLEEGDTVEIVVDDGECSLSYRFKAQVSWVRDEEESAVGLSFVGVPLLLRFSQTERRVTEADADADADVEVAA